MQNSQLADAHNQVLSVPIDTTFFRHVMRKFATGVTVLTVRDGDSLHGLAAVRWLRGNE